MSKRAAARKSLLNSLQPGYIVVDDNPQDSVYAANYFKLNPNTDFPKHGETGSIILTFDHGDHTSSSQPSSTSSSWFSSSNATPESPSSSSEKPLRMAVSSTGLSKEICQTHRSGGRPFDVWPPNDLVNFALSGEDTDFLTGEDALVSAHVGDDSDTRHQYVRISQKFIRKGVFNHETLPLPVYAPVGSYTSLHSKKTSNSNVSITDTTTHTDLPQPDAVFAPQTKCAVMAVADGVGGMAALGDQNQTKEMSHQLMRLVRQHLTADTESARELLGQAFFSLIASNNVTLGACTTALALVQPTTSDEPEDEFDDGKRLSLTIANAGDSAVIAFRPKPYGRSGQYSYIPLALSWPMHHKWNTGNPPPFQFTIPPPEMSGLRPDPLKETPNQAGIATTSHYLTPTSSYGEKCPSGGDSTYISKFDYRQIFSGRKELADHFRTKEKLVSIQRDFINSMGEVDVDSPWFAQGPDNVKLRRGDIVCVFSDGIADNLRTSTFTNTVSEVWESLMGYVNPGIRRQHPLTRHVRNFRDIGQSHLGDLILPKDGMFPTNEINQLANAFIEGGIPAQEESSTAVHPQLTPYHSNLDHTTENVVAGTLSSMLAGGIVRLCQKGWKVDDMSVVVGVIY